MSGRAASAIRGAIWIRSNARRDAGPFHLGINLLMLAVDGRSDREREHQEPRESVEEMTRS